MAYSITYRQVEAFKEVMRTGSITLAAESLAISQPAVSRLIADLEFRLNLRLFIRHPNYLEVTTESRLLENQVNQLYIGLEKIERAAHAISNLESGHLRIVALPVLMDGFLPHVLADFHKDYPGVCVEIESSARSEIYDRIQSNQFDIGLSVTSNIKRPKISSSIFRMQNAVCAVPVKHELSTKKYVFVKEVVKYPFIALPIGSPFRAEIDTIFSRLKIVPNIVFESRTQQSICQLVSRDCGIAIVDEAVKYFINPEKIRLIPIRPNISWEVVLLHPKNIEPSIPQKQFVKYLYEYQ